MICGGVSLVGAILCAVAPNFAVMVFARVVLGFAVGSASVTVPVYLAEMAPKQRRGRMVTVNELMIVTGQMLAFLINAIISLFDNPDIWRWMLAVATVPAIALLAGLPFLPDTPRWYILQGRTDDARKVLALSRNENDAQSEFDEIADRARQHPAQGANSAALKELRRTPWMRKIMYFGMGMALTSQLTGIGVVMFYAPTILESTGVGTDSAIVLSVGVGVVGIVGTLLGIYLLGHLNRKPMLIAGFAGIAASHVLTSVFFLLDESPTRSYAILGGMLMMVFFQQTCIGILCWLLLAEIFPLNIRGFANGIAVLVIWAMQMKVSFVFPLLVDALGSSMTFALFAIFNVGSVTFAALYSPETRGRSLEELESEFQAKGTTATGARSA